MDHSLPFDAPDHAPRFDGATYERAADHARLTGQILRVFACVRDGAWRTLREVAATTGDPEASVSAQLRHLRKARFGAHTLERRSRGDRATGLYEYRLLINPQARIDWTEGVSCE